MNVTRSRLFPFALLLIIFIFLVSTTAYAQFDGGDGAEENPWQIATIEQLQSIADNPDAHFILTADIDASSTADWNEGLGFETELFISTDYGDSDSFFKSFENEITGLYKNRVPIFSTSSPKRNCWK